MAGLELATLPADMKEAISSSREAGFSFISVPSSSPSMGSIVRQELQLDNKSWARWVMIRLCHHRGLDSKVNRVRRQAQEQLSQELSAASYLGVQQVIVRLTSGDNINLARILYSEILGRALYEVLVEVGGDGWSKWNQLRLLTDSSDKLKVCLRLTEKLPTDLQLERWMAEPLVAVSQNSSILTRSHINSFKVIAPTSIFRINAEGSPVLSTQAESILRTLSRLKIEVSISLIRTFWIISLTVEVIVRGGGGGVEMKVYQDYLERLTSSQEEVEERILPQPGGHQLDCSADFAWHLEGDTALFSQYEEALTAAMSSLLSEVEVLEVVVLSAGLGRLVTAVLAASERSDRKVLVTAVVESESALATLYTVHQDNKWGERVLLSSSPPSSHQAHILVCAHTALTDQWHDLLAVAETFLRPGGVIIPSGYTSFLAPVQSAKAFRQVREMRKELEIQPSSFQRVEEKLYSGYLEVNPLLLGIMFKFYFRTIFSLISQS